MPALYTVPRSKLMPHENFASGLVPRRLRHYETQINKDRLTKELKELRESNLQAEKELQAARKAQQEYEKNLKDTRDEYESRLKAVTLFGKGSRKCLRAKIQKHEAQNERMAAEIELLNTQLKQAKERDDRVTKTELENINLRKSLEEVEDRCANLEAQNKSATEAMADLELRVANMDSRREGRCARIAEAIEILQGAQEQVQKTMRIINNGTKEEPGGELGSQEEKS